MPAERFSGRSASDDSAMMRPAGRPIVSTIAANGTIGTGASGRIAAAVATIAKPPIITRFGLWIRSDR